MASSKLPPYVNGYGGISKLLTKIKTASVPPKVNQDFIATVLGLKSSSYRAMIPLLKRLGFIDQANVPTQRYKDFRSNNKSGFVMAKAIKESYTDIYKGNEYAHQLGKNELSDLISTITGSAKNDPSVTAVAGTFMELVKHASFDVNDIPEEIGETEQDDTDPSNGNGQKNKGHENQVKLGIAYTINLNLPATTEIKVFDAIFKSLKKNLIDEGVIR